MIFWLYFIIIAVLAMLIIGIRQYRLRQLRKQIQCSYPIQQLSQKGELTALAGLSAIELCWYWHNVDTQLISATNFSSSETINNGFDFAQYIHQHVSDMDTQSLLGFKRRLMGYVGEQNVADLLIEQGHIVEVAQTANQPVWDLLVDNQAINVKTVQDIASIKAQALAHPDIIYLVPEDAFGEASNNIIKLDGFNHEQLANLTNEAIDNSLEPTESLMNVASHLPIVPLLFSIIKNRKAVEQGRDQDVAIKHIILDTLGRGGGAGLGTLIGGSIGTIGGPIGTLIGSALGAVIGGIFGLNITEKRKQQPLQKALEKFEELLQKFGGIYANRLPRILHLLHQPFIRKNQALQQINEAFKLKKKKLQWWFFPDFHTVLLEQAIVFAHKNVNKEKVILAKIELQLTDAHTQQDYRPLALVILNIPHIREILGTDLLLLRYINIQCEKVYYERSQLYPEQFPPKTKKIT